MGATAFFYNFGFFTLLAYSPFPMHLDAHGLGFVFLANPPNARRGNRLAIAARIIRSAEFSLGFLAVRRRTLSSWRRRRSSTSRSRSPSSLSTTRPITKRRQP
jgi:hypothetical protein